MMTIFYFSLVFNEILINILMPYVLSVVGSSLFLEQKLTQLTEYWIRSDKVWYLGVLWELCLIITIFGRLKILQLYIYPTISEQIYNDWASEQPIEYLYSLMTPVLFAKNVGCDVKYLLWHTFSTDWSCSVDLTIKILMFYNVEVKDA